MRGKRPDLQSEVYAGELNSMAIVHRNSKLVISTFCSLDQSTHKLNHYSFLEISSQYIFTEIGHSRQRTFLLKLKLTVVNNERFLNFKKFFNVAQPQI